MCVMGWVRLRKRYGASLAIAAMALQLVLSFGHVHVQGIGHNSPIVTASAQDGAATPDPTQNKPDNDDYCAICASISLLSGSVVAVPPHLPLPVLSYAVEHADRVVSVIIAPRRAPFQSRAPPQA
jgi:DUF2946 family protein